MDRRPNELSGGEQQRVAVARAFVNRPLILLADEPTGNLDPGTTAGIMRLLERINQYGTTVVMATHQQDVVDAMRKRVIELDQGQVVRDQARGVYGMVDGRRPAAYKEDPGSTSVVRKPVRTARNGGNLVRNIVMTVAAVVTMAVSLTALGGVLIHAPGDKPGHGPVPGRG